MEENSNSVPKTNGDLLLQGNTWRKTSRESLLETSRRKELFGKPGVYSDVPISNTYTKLLPLGQEDMNFTARKLNETLR